MAGSAQWKATLDRNGWDDQFLPGPAFRQFLLAEQSRIEDVLRRLSAADAGARSSLAFTVTPMTIPAATTFILALALAAAIVKARRIRIEINPTGLRMLISIAIGLLVLPALFVTVGFMAASTLLFALTSSALRARPPTARSMSIDLAAGAIVSLLLFIVFTRGLGVSLPGPRL